ncbi:sugar kinase [Clostridium oceanicum]|uniref:2-dehydro-3-deoxygluconokinase n=1 Tax=Clostridium oceanicum TaxID=1543 RepID=A0ABP3UKI6_9CLOT
MIDIVTIGETMVNFIPDQRGYLRYAKNFSMKIAGAESNVAIGVAKLGHSSGWISKLGKDEFGEIILKELRSEGVDVSSVIQTSNNPTGVMFKQFSIQNETNVMYYRSNSAASTLGLNDIDIDYLKKARIIHISGVTPMLSETCKEAIYSILDFAEKFKIPVSFDPNIRLKLMDKDEAKACLYPFLEKSDIVMLGQGEAELLLGLKNPEEIIYKLRDLGVKKIAIKMGDKGAVVADSKTIVNIPLVKTVLVDTVGAGDAFNSGFLTGLIEKRSIEECGNMGALMGALAVSTNGDTEGLISREDFDHLYYHKNIIYR